jgi:hypothetical protein
VQQEVQLWAGWQVPPIAPQVNGKPQTLEVKPHRGTQSRKAGARSTHAPPTQVSHGMRVPHTDRLRQTTPSHRSSRTHDPPTHHSSAPQRTPQSPQFAESVDVSTHAM